MDTLHVLLVDDDRNLVMTLSHGLRKAMGEEVSVAVSFSGSEALSLLETQTFDVVISDYNMPGTSGLEFLHEIRHNHGEIVLVLITAFGTDALEEGARKLGVGYITKPFEPSFLADTLRFLIRSEKHTDRTETTMHIMDELGKPVGSSSGGFFEGKSLE
jgi:DNA-binding response OmpR family regulator